MPSSSVFDIAQHPSGMMWFITKAGPTYYDAKKWYSFPDSLGLPSSENSKIIIVDSTVWVAGFNKTDFTIQKYQKEWTELEFPLDASSFKRHITFNVFHSEGKSHVLVGSDHLLTMYDGAKDKWSQIELANHTINSIHSVDNKQVICTSQGLLEVKDGKLDTIPLPYQKLPNKNILTLAYKNGVLYLLGLNWFAEIQNDNVKYLQNDVGLLSSSISNQSSIIVDQGGKVIFCASTPARIINYENNTWQNLLINGENLNIGGTRIFCDRENNVWVGGSRGLLKFNVLKFLNYNQYSGLADNEVTVVTQLQSGEMILANPYDFNILKGNSIKQYSYQWDKDLNYRILAIEEDTINNLLYMSTNVAGLLVYKRNKYKEPYQVYNNNEIRVTAVKSFKGRIYIAGSNGIFRIEKDIMRKINTDGGIRNISNLGSRLAFLSNAEGVLMFDGYNFKHYTSNNLDLKSVYQAVIYNGDTLLATRDGVGIIRSGEIQRWEKVSIKSPTYGLLIDRNNQIWIGGDEGVYIFNGETLQQYNLDEGLSGNEINRNALYEDNEGQIWIGTENGASVFLNDSEFEKNLNLKVKIVEVKTEQGNSYEDNRFPYQDNSIQVAFQCLSYVDEDKINFRYSIDKTKVKWVEESDQSTSIFLSNLESGEFTFRIQARYGSGDWGPMTTFDFTIKKPFFMRWWFIALAIVLLIISVRITFRFRYLYLIKKQKNLKLLVAERTKEVTLLNAELEEKVKLRTKELNDKNLRLEESAFMNAHHLRGPLTKIMSALQIAELEDNKLMSNEIYNILKEAVQELDAVIFSINDILSKE